MDMDLQGKHILLGVTGSIAAYKSVLVLRQLVQAGAQVTVVMTSSAQKFITPLTFQVLSRRPVYESVRSQRGNSPSDAGRAGRSDSDRPGDGQCHRQTRKRYRG